MASARSSAEPVPVFVINLDRAVDRWSRISSDLAARGVSFQRWRAVDGRDVDARKFGREEIEPGVFVSGFRDWSGNEAACGISHIRVLRHIVASAPDWSIVLEDDAEPIGVWPRTREDWRFPADADIVFLNRRAAPGDPVVGNPAYATLVGGAGTEGYAVSRAGARKLLTILAPLKDPLDFQIYAHCEGVQAADGALAYWTLPQNPSARDVLLKAYRSVPPLVDHAEGDSTIGGARHPRARFYCRVLLDMDLPDGRDYGKLVGGDVPPRAARPIADREIRGVDISHLAETARYRCADGREIACPLRFLAAHGVTHARISVWVGEGSRQSLARATRLAERARNAGLAIYLALHLSETWADPARQRKPEAWRGLALDDLAAEVQAHVDQVLDAMQACEAPPDIVQIGNEITNGLLWDEADESWLDGGRLFDADPGTSDDARANWSGMVRLIAAASSAIRAHATATGKSCRVALQIDRGAWPDVAAWWFDRARLHGADFDIIALSFYPLSHAPATLPRLAALELLSSTFPDKALLIAETSYPFRTPDTLARPRPGEPAFTAQGQALFLSEMLRLGRKLPTFLGLCWWGAFFTNADVDPASDFFLAQALFDDGGQALPALHAFAEPTP